MGSGLCVEPSSCGYADGKRANKGACKCGSEICASGNTCVAKSSKCDIYTGRPVPEGYAKVITGGCPGRNELGSKHEAADVQACADKCDVEPTCVSFEYQKFGTTKATSNNGKDAPTKCMMSTSCNDIKM